MALNTHANAWTTYNRTQFVEVMPAHKTGAYAASQVVGGLLTVTFASPGGGGVVRKVSVVDDLDVKAALTLHLFRGTPNTMADAAAYQPSLAALKLHLARVDIATSDFVSYNDGSGNNAVAHKSGLNIDTGSALTAYLVTVATPTWGTASSLTLIFDIWTD